MVEPQTSHPRATPLIPLRIESAASSSAVRFVCCEKDTEFLESSGRQSEKTGFIGGFLHNCFLSLYCCIA